MANDVAGTPAYAEHRSVRIDQVGDHNVHFERMFLYRLLNDERTELRREISQNNFGKQHLALVVKTPIS